MHTAIITITGNIGITDNITITSNIWLFLGNGAIPLMDSHLCNNDLFTTLYTVHLRSIISTHILIDRIIRLDHDYVFTSSLLSKGRTKTKTIKSKNYSQGILTIFFQFQLVGIFLNITLLLVEHIFI